MRQDEYNFEAARRKLSLAEQMRKAGREAECVQLLRDVQVIIMMLGRGNERK